MASASVDITLPNGQEVRAWYQGYWESDTNAFVGTEGVLDIETDKELEAEFLDGVFILNDAMESETFSIKRLEVVLKGTQGQDACNAIHRRKEFVYNGDKWRVLRFEHIDRTKSLVHANYEATYYLIEYGAETVGEFIERESSGQFVDNGGDEPDYDYYDYD